jgi:hypothetical protein
MYQVFAHQYGYYFVHSDSNFKTINSHMEILIYLLKAVILAMATLEASPATPQATPTATAIMVVVDSTVTEVQISKLGIVQLSQATVVYYRDKWFVGWIYQFVRNK